jgi:hypothetical protein
METYANHVTITRYADPVLLKKTVQNATIPKVLTQLQSTTGHASAKKTLLLSIIRAFSVISQGALCATIQIFAYHVHQTFTKIRQGLKGPASKSKSKKAVS